MAAGIFLANTTVIPAIGGPNPTPSYQTIRYVATPEGTTFYQAYVNDPDGAGDANTYLQANITSLVTAAVATGKLVANSIVGTATSNTQITTLYGTTVNPYILDRLLILVFAFQTITAPPTITVGTTSGGAQILAATSLTGYGALKSKYIQLDAAAPIATLTNAAGTPIWVNVTVAATGTGTPAFNFTVTPFGKNALDL